LKFCYLSWVSDVLRYPISNVFLQHIRELQFYLLALGVIDLEYSHHSWYIFDSQDIRAVYECISEDCIVTHIIS
jgi:hypothetical protein